MNHVSTSYTACFEKSGSRLRDALRLRCMSEPRSRQITFYLSASPSACSGALVHAGISPEYLPDAFDHSVAALVSFIMTDLPLAGSPGPRQRLRVLHRSFPTLMENRGSLVAMIEMRREAATKLEPDLTRADAFARLLVRNIDAMRERAPRPD